MTAKPEVEIKFRVVVPGQMHSWAESRLSPRTILRAMKALNVKDPHLLEMIKLIEDWIKEERNARSASPGNAADRR